MLKLPTACVLGGDCDVDFFSHMGRRAFASTLGLIHLTTGTKDGSKLGDIIFPGQPISTLFALLYINDD